MTPIKLTFSVHLDEVDVDGPDPFMLGDGQGSQGSIQDTPSSGYQPLRDQEGAVVHPDSWHFVHEHQGPLVRVVHFLVGGVGDALFLHL